MLHHLQREVGDVENDIGVAERSRAELARQPAQAFQVDEHQIDLTVPLRAVERLHGAVVEHTGRLEIGALLEFSYGGCDLAVVTLIVGVLDAELGAQLRHAGIFWRDRALLLGGGLERQCRTLGDMNHRSVTLAAQLGELGLQVLVELVRRVVAVERCGRVLGGRDIGEHFRRIGRVLGILDVGGDLRPVHPAALGLSRIVEHARGQFQFGFGELVRRSGGGKIRHRIVGRIEALGGGVLQTGDHALAAVGQFAGLRPLRRVVARRVELLDGRALVLAVEIAQRFGADHVAQAVGDRLVGWSDGADLDRFLGGFGGRRGGCRSRRRGGCGVVGRRCGRGHDISRFGRGRFFDCLRCVRHRGGGVHLEVAGGRRRTLAGWGAELLRRSRARRRWRAASSTGPPVPRSRTPRGRLPRQPSARGQILHGSSNSHASSHPLGRNCPGMEQSSGIVRHGLRGKRRLDRFSVARLHATVQTQTIHVPLSCSQRHAGQLTTN